MRTIKRFILVVLLVMPLVALAQQVIISGRVIDSETLQPIPFAHIFIVNTSNGGTTDIEGNFSFTSDDYGTAGLIVSFVGYETYKKQLKFSGATLILGTIRLKPGTELDEVVVKGSRDKQWEKDLKKFKTIFLGNDEFAAECTIQNPWMVDLQVEQKTGTLQGKSIAPMVIINKALGYEVSFNLRRFTSNSDGYSIEGDAWFKNMEAETKQERDRWTRNRETVYRRSVTNLLKAIVNHKINNEGFILYTELPGQNTTFARFPRFPDNVGTKIMIADTTTLATSQAGTDKFLLSFKGRLEIHYRYGKLQQRVYNDVNYPVSWISLDSNPVVVNASGVPEKQTDVIVFGAMSNDRLSCMLPLNYTSRIDKSKLKKQSIADKISLMYEKIYMHTDKPYYYAGEKLWFKGYVNYESLVYRDSLSHTVYVDLIAPDKKILLSKILRSDSGRFSAQLDIPVGLDAGTYNLRAYTNLQRNFGDSTLYVKTIPIVDLKDMVEGVAPKQTSSNGISITATKDNYKSREKIEVKIKLTDSVGNPLRGELSMSVTDIKQVSPVRTAPDITEAYPIKEIPPVTSSATSKPYTSEQGITLHGKFLNTSGKPEKASLNVVQINPKNFDSAESDGNGFFTAGNFMIYDSSRFSITASDKKGRPYGRAVLLEGSKPAVIYRNLSDNIKIVPTASLHRDLKEYNKVGDARLLDPVEIRGKRILDEYKPDFRVKRPYGKANYALTPKDFGNRVFANVLMALPGRFPGLIVRQALNPGEDPRWVVYLQRNDKGSVNNVKEVVVTVNDAFMGGTPEQILSAIDMSMVQAIELRTTVNVLYGNVSNQGILAIYLRDGMSATSPMTKTIGTVKATGYSFSPAFSSPDYSEQNTELPDYRSTIFWAPVVIVGNDGTATVSFFSADLDTSYQVEVEGIDSEGKPVRAVKIIQVAK